ncbi:hypothetical protein GCM10007904_05010 [Oharaeibacter diazotrophicus]|nr:hypothetical protein GCM10007904_05010 [Oharaeibacter diazotrophicus]
MGEFDLEAPEVVEMASEEEDVVGVVFDIEHGDRPALRNAGPVLDDLKPGRPNVPEGIGAAIERANHGDFLSRVAIPGPPARTESLLG